MGNSKEAGAIRLFCCPEYLIVKDQEKQKTQSLKMTNQNKTKTKTLIVKDKETVPD